MHRLWPFLTALGLSFGLSGFEAPAPSRTPPPPLLKPPLSFVSATLRVPADAIISMLNDRTRSQLARVQNQDVNCLVQKCQLDLIATRTGDLTGQAVGSGMHLKLPFALHVHLAFNGKYLKTGGDAVAQGVADSVTQISLQPDWRMQSHTEGEVHLSDAKLKLGPLKIRVTKLWNDNAQQLSDPIFRMIDKRIVQAFKLRGQVERLWKKLLQPIRIGKDPDTWLVLSPERVRVTPIRTQNGALTIALAAAVRARAIVGDATPTSKTAAELPPPEMLDVASNTFEASVPVTLSYGEAARLAMERLKKKPLQAAGMKLGIDKLVILPSGQDLIVQAHFCLGRKWDFTHLLDSCGDIYLRGVPKFDAANDKIEIANLHYDIASQNLMLRIMRALSGDALGKALQPHLVFDESREIEKLKRNIATALAKPQGRGVTLSGRITSFGQPKLTWTKDGFLALFSAKGTIAAALNMKQPG